MSEGARRCFGILALIRRFAPLAIFCLLWPLLAFAQTTSIQGIVTRAGGSDPLTKATVEIRIDEPNASLLNTITTEDDGRFVFQNLRPGRYRLTVTRQGYVRPPLSITIAAGQAPSNIQLPMAATGAIFGHIYGSDGQPHGNLLVQALKATYPEGQRVLTPVQNVATNDLGEYRFFWLPPGRYYVAAIPPDSEPVGFGMFRRSGYGSMTLGGTNSIFMSSGNTDPAATPPIAREYEEKRYADRYVPVYYSGTTDDQVASAIDIRAGTEFGGVNLVLAPVRERHVRGLILDGATGKPVEYGSIEIIDELQALRSGKTPDVNRETGAFDLTVLPGTHTLAAGSASGSGYATVHVADSDVENVVIRVAPGFDVTGRMTIEGRPGNNTDIGQLQLRLRRPGIPFRPTEPYSTPLPNGSFTLDGELGDFRINVAPILNVIPNNRGIKLPPNLANAYVKSIRLGNIDVLNEGLHLERRPDVPLEIVLGTNPGTITGTVGAGDIAVVLLPNLRGRIDLYQTTTSDPYGKFRFDKVSPGDYKLFAWSEVENGSWFDADFMRNYENRGAPIHVDEGRTLDVRVQPN